MVSGSNLLRAILVTFFFDAAVFGTFSFYTVIAGMLMNVLISVFVEPATSLSAQMDPARRRRYFFTLAYLLMGLMLLSAFPMYEFTTALTRSFLNTTGIQTLTATLFVLFFLGVGIVRAFAQAFARPEIVFGFDFIQALLSLSFLAVVLLGPAFLPDIGASNLIILSQTAGLGLCLLAATGFVLFRWGPGGIDFSVLRMHGRRSIAVTCVTALRALQVNTPALWTQFLLGEGVFGLLRLYQTVANFVSLPANALRLVNMATGARALQKGGRAALVAYVVRITTRLSLLAGAISSLILVFALVLPAALRPSVAGFGYIFLFLLFNTLAVVNSSVSSFFYASGRLTPLITRSALSALLCVVLSPVLISAMGGFGAPISQISVSLFAIATTIVFVTRNTHDLAA